MIKRSETTVDTCIDDFTAVLAWLRSVHVNTWVELDLSMAQVKVLMTTLHAGGLTSTAIAEKLGVRPSAVTPLVDKLVQQKLVKREDDERDRRVIWIRPTTKALALHEKLMASNRAVIGELLADVDDAQLELVQRGLAALADAARRKLPKEKP